MKVAVVPDPVCVNAPGDAVIVHDPEAGSPLKATEPVGVVHVGWVTVPTMGVLGGVGATFMAADVEAVELQPEAFVTVKM